MGVDHKSLLHHLLELWRDEQHGKVLRVLDLDVEADGLSGALLMDNPRPAPNGL